MALQTITLQLILNNLGIFYLVIRNFPIIFILKIIHLQLSNVRFYSHSFLLQKCFSLELASNKCAVMQLKEPNI